FAAQWAGGEAADFAGLGIGAQHLVVAHAGVFAAVAVVAIGFDPQPTVGVEGEAVGAVEHVVGVDVVAAGVKRVAVDGGVACYDEQIPVEAVGAVVAVSGRPANDLTIEIAFARVGGVDRLILANAAI